MTELRGKSNVEPTQTIYARVPGELKVELDKWAAEHRVSLSMGVRLLLERGMAVEGSEPAPGRNPWIDRAVLIQALRDLDIVRPTGYSDLGRLIAGALTRAGDG